MGNAYGQSSQTFTCTFGDVGPLKATRCTLKKTFHNDDTTVTDQGWGKLCPIYREWAVEVELPSRTSDSSQTLLDAFDAALYPSFNVEDVTLPTCVFTLPNGRTYTGSGAPDGEAQVRVVAKNAVVLMITFKGSDELVQSQS